MNRLSSTIIPANTQENATTTSSDAYAHLEPIGHAGLLNPKTKRRNEIHEKLSACLPLQSGSLSRVSNGHGKPGVGLVMGPHSRTTHMHRLVSGCPDFLRGLKEPEVGPPLGETGRCDVGFNYMGMPRANNTQFFVETFDPDWCTRKVTISLGKLLRRNLLSKDVPHTGIGDNPLLEESIRTGFCSFKKVVQRVYRKQLDHIIGWTFDGLQQGGGGGGGDHPLHLSWKKLGLPEMGFTPILETHSIFMTLMFRVVIAQKILLIVPPGELSLYTQLWMDNHLDMLEFCFMGGKDGRTPPSAMSDDFLRESGSLLLLYPDNCRHVRAGALMDLSGVLIHGNVWREMFMSPKDPLDVLLICLRNKQEPHKCLIRWYDKRVTKYMQKDKRLMSLMKDILHVMVLGNFPVAGVRPCAGARIRLRRYMLKMSRWDVTKFSSWVKKYRNTLYYMVREFHHHTTLRQPGLEEALRESQSRRMHLPMMLQAGDNAREILSRQLGFHSPGGRGGGGGGRGRMIYNDERLITEVFESVDLEYGEHHAEQKITYSKLVHEDFETMVYRQMRKWWLKTPDKCSIINRYGRYIIVPVDHTNSPFSKEMILGEKKTRENWNPDRMWKSLDEISDPDILSPGGIASLFFQKRKEWSQATSIPDVAKLLLGPSTMRMVHKSAIHLGRAVDSALSPWWLRVMGMSYGSYLWVINMFKHGQPRNTVEFQVDEWLDFLFGYNPTDFVLFYMYLMERFSRPPVPDHLPFVYLGDDVARNQLEACRKKEGLMAWQPSDLSVMGNRYYCGCGSWAEVVVNDNDERDIHAIGLSNAIYDCVTKKVRCNRGRRQCYDELKEVNLIGKAVRLKKKWYTLCAKCSSLTPWTDYKNSQLGPDCGCHTPEPINRISDVMQLRSLTTTALLPIARYNMYGLYNGKVGQDVGIHCTFCGKSLDIASRQYTPLWTVVSWKSSCYFLHAFKEDAKIRPDREDSTTSSLVNWSIGGIQPPTPLHQQTLTALQMMVSKEFRLRATHLELKILQFIASRYHTYLYKPEDMARIVPITHKKWGHGATPNQIVGPRQVFLCRTDYVYATRTATYPCVPECQSVWKYVRTKRTKRAKDMMRQSQWTNDIIGITKLYATGGFQSMYYGKKVGSSRRRRKNTSQTTKGPPKRRTRRKTKKKEEKKDVSIVFRFFTGDDGSFEDTETMKKQTENISKKKKKVTRKRTLSDRLHMK